MAEKLKRSQLAAAWGVSAAHVTQSMRRYEQAHGIPRLEFESIEEADAWRMVNCPPKPGNVRRQTEASETSSETTAPPAQKPFNTPTTTTAKGKRGRVAPPAEEAEAEVVTIDVESYVRHDVDFDELMIAHAKRVPQIAHGLLEREASLGVPHRIAAATANWHGAVRAAADVRERFVEMQERTRQLLPLDEVLDVLGAELQAVRSALLGMGKRLATAANPDNPALAEAVIDAEIDRVFARFDALPPRVVRELGTPVGDSGAVEVAAV